MLPPGLLDKVVLLVLPSSGAVLVSPLPFSHFQLSPSPPAASLCSTIAAVPFLAPAPTLHPTPPPTS